MTSRITNSLRKKAFASNLLKEHVVKCSFQKKNHFQENIIVRDKDRKDRGVRQAYYKSGKASALK